MTPEEIKQQGKEAFASGSRASNCPYTFDKSAFWKGRDYTGFNAVRWKLDAWMAGWIEAQRESRAADRNASQGRIFT